MFYAMVSREIFLDWRIRAGSALLQRLKERPRSTLIATGGIRDGLTTLKADDAGTDMADMGRPVMRLNTALERTKEPSKRLGLITKFLKNATLVSGL